MNIKELIKELQILEKNNPKREVFISYYKEDNEGCGYYEEELINEIRVCYEESDRSEIHLMN